jgi:hypothetical protein
VRERQRRLSRERFNSAWRIRLREPARDQVLDGLSREAACFAKQGVRILRGQIRRQQEQAGQVDSATAKLVDDARQASGELRDANTLGRFILAVAAAFYAIAAQTGARLIQVQARAFDLGQIRDHLRDGRPLAREQPRHPCDKIRIGHE